MPSKRFLIVVGLIFSLLVGGLFAPQPVYAASTLFVTPDGVASGSSCLSWATACSLQFALSLATSGDQIWVKTGTYKPGISGARTATFTLKNGVSIYGGFVGGESALGARNWTEHLTVLSGDLNDNGLDDQDAYHVATASGVNSSAVLDGFTITGGNANVNVFPNFYGGGILADIGSPTLSNLIVDGNSSGGLGGAMYLYKSSPTFTNVTFSNNTAYMYGGALYLLDGSNPTLNQVTFVGNAVHGGNGGAMQLSQSSPTLNNVIFVDNIAYALQSGNTSTGGGGGAIDMYASNPTMTHVIFSGNVAEGNGGALDIGGTSNPTFTHVTMTHNSARFGGGAIYVSDSSFKMRNSILWGDTSNSLPSEIFTLNAYPNYVRTLIQGGGATLDADPLFVDAAHNDLRLRPASPAINYGENTLTAPALPTTDMAGNPRIADGVVDLGAYENQGPYNSAPVLAGSFDGLALLEDPASNPGYLVSDLIAGHVTDADGTAGSAGVAVFAADNTNGSWQFSADGGGAWTAFGTVSGTASVLLGPAARIRFAPNAHWNGTASVSFRAWDVPPDLRETGASGVNSSIYGGHTSFSAATGEISWTVQPVNDAPSFTKGADQIVLKDSGAQAVSGWATAISAGPANEAGQQLEFVVSNDHNALFSAQPALSASGDLTYTPASGATGLATVSVALRDDGGVANGGADISAARTFTILVTPPTIFVDASATGDNSGSSWANAYVDLRTALANSTTGCEIWVAAGVYTPGEPGDNAATFALKSGVSLYGGFAGVETSRAARSLRNNLTILSGDLNANAGHDSADAYQVVTATRVDDSAVLDGFTITGGYASGAFQGAGMYLTDSSPILNNIAIRGNSTDTFGGGMTLMHSNPVLNNVLFHNNTAGMYGGGLTLLESNPILNNVTLNGNAAATSGGGMLFYKSSPQIRNSIVWGNTAGSDAQISVFDSNISSPLYTRVLIEGGGGPLDVDPLFVNAAAGDLRLQPNSPAINAGDNSVADPGLPPTDLDGYWRVVDGTVDLGAYEACKNVFLPVVVK